MESHHCFCCRKEAEAPRPKPRTKLPMKVHVWAGMSVRGRTGIDGIMEGYLHIDIIDKLSYILTRSVSRWSSANG